MLGVGNVMDIAMPQGVSRIQPLGTGIATQPALATARQVDPVFALPDVKAAGRMQDAFPDAGQIIVMNALKNQCGIRERLFGSNCIDILYAVAGVREETMAVGVALELVEHARHVFCQQVALQLLQMLFGGIGKGADKMGGLAALATLDNPATELDPFIVAVAAAQAVCAFKKIQLPFKVQFQIVQGVFPVFRMNQAFPLTGGRVAGVIAEQGVPLWREIGSARFALPVPDSLAGGFHDQAPAGFKVGALLGKCELVIQELAAALQVKNSEQQCDGGQAIKESQLPGFAVPGKKNGFQVAANAQYQRVIHSQAIWSDGVHDHQTVWLVRQYRSFQHAGRLTARPVAAKNSTGLGQIGVDGCWRAAVNQKTLAVAMRKSGQRIGGKMGDFQ